MVTGEVEQRDLTQSGPAVDPEEIAERCAAASDRLPGSHRIVASGRNRLSGTPERLRSEDSKAEPVSDRALSRRSPSPTTAG